MRTWNSLKRYFRQIKAYTEKELSLRSRIKGNLITLIVSPIVQLLLLIFIFQTIFNVKSIGNIGYWNADNYILFLLLGFCITSSKSITNNYRRSFNQEKYWKTLSAIMVAPVNRFTLLASILVSELVVNSISLIVVFVIAYIFFPIPLIFLILTFLVFFSIVIIFAGIGLFIGVFQMSNEKYVPILLLMLRILLLFSCISYPRQILPQIIQEVVILNPLYYIFDLLKLTWYLGIDYESAISQISIMHIISILLITIITPVISIIMFNRVYKKKEFKVIKIKN